MRTRVFAVGVVLLGIALPTAGLAARSSVDQVSAKLRGSAEVPKGSPTGSGLAKVTLDLKRSRACWTIAVHGIGKPLSAHVHKARPGKTGPVVIPLGAKFMTKGCVKVPLTTARAVAKNPRGYYVNVHTRTYLGGALRGQLHG
jgi:hypothetical protein